VENERGSGPTKSAQKCQRFRLRRGLAFSLLLWSERSSISGTTRSAEHGVLRRGTCRARNIFVTGG